LVGELYDYMIGIVVVGVIFTSAVFAIPAISYVNLLQVDQQQLRNTALNVFNAMLLGTGSPSDWGSTFPFDQNNVEAFGLALSEEPSLYILDTDKVQRLDQDSPGHIEYQRVRDLLNLKSHGFSVSIFRPFTVNALLNITGEKTTNPCIGFAVNVTRNEDGRPIPNAQVSCTTVVTASHSKGAPSGEPIAVIISPKTYSTDMLGHCEANEFVSIPDGYGVTDALSVLEISVAGMKTMVLARARDEPLQDFVKIYTFGDTITLKVRNEFLEKGGGERRIRDISSYNYGEQLMQIFDGSGGNPPDLKITPGVGYEVWNMTFPGLKATNPFLLLFTLRVKNPDRLVIIVGPFSLFESSKVFSFGPDPEQIGGVVVKLRRYVVFSGMTFIAELTLWKE